MRNLQPDHTKVRIYLDPTAAESKENTLIFLNRVREFSVDAVCEATSPGSQTAIEVLARRDVIHEKVVTLIEETVPNAFVTLEAVCAFRTRTASDHPVYGKADAGQNKVVRLHQ